MSRCPNCGHDRDAGYTTSGGQIGPLERQLAAATAENERLRGALLNIAAASSQSFESLAVYAQNIARSALDSLEQEAG